MPFPDDDAVEYGSLEELAERLTPPEIPYDVVTWFRRIFPPVKAVHGRTIEEWEYQAGIEHAVSLLEDAYQIQQEAAEETMRGGR